MKTPFTFICLLTMAELSSGQTVIDSANRIDSMVTTGTNVHAIAARDTAAKGDTTQLIVTVQPEEAMNAKLTVVRKTRIVLQPNGKSTYTIPPDTCGIWYAPLSVFLARGNYDIVARNQGFRAVLRKLEIGEKLKDSLAIEMYSLEYLRHRREQWNTAKWVSAGATVVAGIATYYFSNRINVYTDRYNSAIALDVINDSRDKIHANQSYFHTSSAITLTTAGGFLISWLVESLYHE